MRISIVTISYNQARFLERAICSIINQDYSDLEYIVVDSGSTDGSREIIKKYEDRIDKIIFEPDNGPADGLNKGFAQATGDIFGFINADDALLPGALKKVARFFDENQDIDVVGGHLYQVDEKLRLIKRVRTTYFEPRRYVYGGVQIAQQSTFFRKRAFADVGGFNVNNITSWDGELLLKMNLAGYKFAILHEYLAIFRIHSFSISGSQTRWAESLKNHKRYFIEVMKREPNKLDQLLGWGYRIEKWCRDPVGLVTRIYDIFRPYIFPVRVDLSDGKLKPLNFKTSKRGFLL